MTVIRGIPVLFAIVWKVLPSLCLVTICIRCRGVVSFRSIFGGCFLRSSSGFRYTLVWHDDKLLDGRQYNEIELIIKIYESNDIDVFVYIDNGRGAGGRYAKFAYFNVVTQLKPP